jgi:hypothetical protein
MSAFDELPQDLDLSPQTVAAYLGTAGWRLADASDLAQLWELGDGGHLEARLRLPVEHELADFDRRVEEALHRICLVNDWSADQLAMNVLNARSDFMFIRADQAAADGSIPLMQAQTMLEGARELMLAAAQSTIRARSEHRGRRSDLARSFVQEDVRMGHTQRGSFIITILTHLGEEEIIPVDDDDSRVLAAQNKALQLPQAEAAREYARLREAAATGTIRIAPFQRRVMSTLATGLDSAREMALQSGAHTLDEAVARGLSANLVDALTGMTRYDGLRSLDVSFSWSKTEPEAQPSVEQIRVDRDVIPRLEPLKTRLERRPPEPDVETIHGQVTRLERGTDDESGTVTITGFIGRVARTVRIELVGTDYNEAIRAHRSRTTVTSTGTLMKRGNSYYFGGDVVFAPIK